MERNTLDTRKIYEEAIEEDIQSFIGAIRNWTALMIGNEAADSLSFRSSMNFTQGDNRDRDTLFSSRNITTCLDKTNMSRMGQLLASLLTTNDAPDQTVQEDAVRSLQWRPLSPCMKDRHLKYLGGGSGAGFQVRCGGDRYHVLLDASCGGGGGGRPRITSHGEYWFRGGSQAHVRLPHQGKITIRGGGRKWKLGKSFERGKGEAMNALSDAMLSCASNRSLWIQGGGGGGWESTSQQENGSDKEQHGFGFDFVLSHPEIVGGSRVAEIPNKPREAPANQSYSANLYHSCLHLSGDSEAIGACWAAQSRDNIQSWQSQMHLIEYDLYATPSSFWPAVVSATVALLCFSTVSLLARVLAMSIRRRGYRAVPDY